MKSRLYIEFSPTPVPFPNQDWQGGVNPKTGKADKSLDAPDPKGNPRLVSASPIQAYARKRPGVELAIVAYEGTFNRSPWWSDSLGNLLDRGDKGTGQEARLAQPISLAAAKAIANLAMHPTRYGDVGSLPIRPIVLDVEGGVMGVPANAPLDQRRAMYQHYIDAVAAIHGVNFNIPVYCFCYPFRQMDKPGGPRHNAGCEDLDQQLASVLSGAVYGAYNLDADALSGGTAWFDRLQAFNVLLDRENPGLRQTRVAFINPVQKVYWPQNLPGDWSFAAALADQPVPMDLWRRQNEALVSLGYDRFLWLGESCCWGEAGWKDYVDAL